MHRIFKVVGLVLVLAALMVVPALADGGTVSASVTAGSLGFVTTWPASLALGSVPFAPTAQTLAPVNVSMSWQDYRFTNAGNHMTIKATPLVNTTQAVYLNFSSAKPLACVDAVANNTCDQGSRMIPGGWDGAVVIPATAATFHGWQVGSTAEMQDFAGTMAVHAVIPARTPPGTYTSTIEVLLLTGPAT